MIYLSIIPKELIFIFGCIFIVILVIGYLALKASYKRPPLNKEVSDVEFSGKCEINGRNVDVIQVSKKQVEQAKGIVFVNDQYIGVKDISNAKNL